jgi:hypothetical protein
VVLQTIASTMDALRGAPASEPLFPDVHFGVAADGFHGYRAHASGLRADAVHDLDALADPPGTDAGRGSQVFGGSVAQACHLVATGPSRPSELVPNCLGVIVEVLGNS